MRTHAVAAMLAALCLAACEATTLSADREQQDAGHLDVFRALEDWARAEGACAAAITARDRPRAWQALADLERAHARLDRELRQLPKGHPAHEGAALRSRRLLELRGLVDRLP